MLAGFSDLATLLPDIATEWSDRNYPLLPKTTPIAKKRKKNRMSKYNLLWEYVRDNGNSSLKLTFEQIQRIAGIAIDHSFLKYKKELTEYGYQVGKISMKEQTVIFSRIDS